MAGIMAPHFENLVITTPGNFKKSDPVMVFAAFHAINHRTELIVEPALAWNRILYQLHCNPISRLLVCGSFYLAGTLLPMLQSSGFSAENEDYRGGGDRKCP